MKWEQKAKDWWLLVVEGKPVATVVALPFPPGTYAAIVATDDVHDLAKKFVAKNVREATHEAIKLYKEMKKA